MNSLRNSKIKSSPPNLKLFKSRGRISNRAKLSVVGSVKIDSRWRRKLFLYGLGSLEPIFSLLSWQLNIVGKYAEFAKKKILHLSKDASLTIDDDSSYYKTIKKQIESSQSNFIFFWQEDHWFLCPNKNLFLYLLQEFAKSRAEILTISHLVTCWETKRLLPIVKDTYLYKERRVDLAAQEKLWQKYPKAYLTGIPAIYKKDIAREILEFNRPYLEKSKLPYGFELDKKRGREFLKERSFIQHLLNTPLKGAGFIEMVPTCHIFREVFGLKRERRALGFREALQILKFRERGDF